MPNLTAEPLRSRSTLPPGYQELGVIDCKCGQDIWMQGFVGSETYLKLQEPAE